MSFSDANERWLSDAIHWETMLYKLPKEGVKKVFPNLDTCILRFAKVRFQHFVTCPRCRSHELGWIVSRRLYQCRECRHQFSVTAGSSLHRSRIPLDKWFWATEAVIRTRRNKSHGVFYRNRSPDIEIKDLAARLSIHVEAAVRMRKIILQDISLEGKQLLSDAICIREFELPDGLPDGTASHFFWLRHRNEFGE